MCAVIQEEGGQAPEERRQAALSAPPRGCGRGPNAKRPLEEKKSSSPVSTSGPCLGKDRGGQAPEGAPGITPRLIERAETPSTLAPPPSLDYSRFSQ